MGLFDQVTSVISQATGKEHGNVESQFDAFCQTGSRDSLASSLTQTFRSSKTPPFASLVAQLFSQGNPQQKTGLLNTLLTALGPALLSQFSNRQGFSGLTTAFQRGQVDPQQAERISPQMVEQLAQHAEHNNPSIVDSIGQFSSQNPSLVKSLGPNF
ncbi:MAG TPA: hypothetical protein VNZ22_17485, partial [Bacillota bacterium]|nr:hypothetical protein [Bacillota bacterium]